MRVTSIASAGCKNARETAVRHACCRKSGAQVLLRGRDDIIRGCERLAVTAVQRVAIVPQLFKRSFSRYQSHAEIRLEEAEHESQL